MTSNSFYLLHRQESPQTQQAIRRWATFNSWLSSLRMTIGRKSEASQLGQRPVASSLGRAGLRSCLQLSSLSQHSLAVLA